MCVPSHQVLTKRRRHRRSNHPRTVRGPLCPTTTACRSDTAVPLSFLTPRFGGASPQSGDLYRAHLNASSVPLSRRIGPLRRVEHTGNLQTRSLMQFIPKISWINVAVYAPAD